MATKTIELKGTLEWAKLFEGNRDQGQYDTATDGATTIDILLDDAGLKIAKDAGVQKKGKREGNLTRIKFKRGWSDPFDRDWAGGPPKVFGPSGAEWTRDDGLIGNGSEGIVFVEVYDTKVGIGTRLAGVQVVDLVAFGGDGGGGSAPSISPKDYTNGATKTSSPTPAPTDHSDSYMDDEIPF